MLSLFSGCAHIQQAHTGRDTYAYGVIAEREDRIDEAIQYYRETIQKAGEDGYLYLKLGNLYLKKTGYSVCKKMFFKGTPSCA